MLLFKTVLPTISDFGKREFVSLAVRWAKQHQRFPDGIEWAGEAPTYLYRDEEAKSEFEALDLPSRSITAIRLQTEDQTAKWTTHCILDTEKHQLTVSLDRQLHAGYESPSQTRFSTPQIIARLIDEEWLDLDGDLPISITSIGITPRNYQIAVNIIKNQSNHNLPVVLLLGNQTPEIDDRVLSNKLKGIAHVLCLSNDKDMMQTIRDELMQQDPQFSEDIEAIIYYPDKTRRLIKNMPQRTAAPTVTHIIRCTLNDMLSKEQDPLTTWSGVKYAATEEKLIESSKTEKEVKTEHKEWVENFEQETGDLQKKISELEERISTLSASEYAAKNEAARLREKLNAKEGNRRPLLYYGEEEDLYDGEISDIILEYLQNALNELANQPTRRRDILASILEANPSGEAPKKLKDEIKRIMTGYNRMSSRIISDMEAIGFSVTKTKAHYKFTFKGDPRYIAIISTTGSDTREGKNIIQTISNILF